MDIGNYWIILFEKLFKIYSYFGVYNIINGTSNVRIKLKILCHCINVMDFAVSIMIKFTSEDQYRNRQQLVPLRVP